MNEDEDESRPESRNRTIAVKACLIAALIGVTIGTVMTAFGSTHETSLAPLAASADLPTP